MGALDSETKPNRKGNFSEKTLVLAGIGVVVVILLAGGIFFLTLQAKPKPIEKSYSNPFAPQKQSTYRNPFSTPAAAYQNPFSANQDQQTTSKPYQNPFGGGR